MINTELHKLGFRLTRKFFMNEVNKHMKKYNFYGWETADATPVDEKYKKTAGARSNLHETEYEDD